MGAPSTGPGFECPGKQIIPFWHELQSKSLETSFSDCQRYPFLEKTMPSEWAQVG